MSSQVKSSQVKSSQVNKSVNFKFALSSLLCSSFLLFSPNSHADLNDGLVAHWSFDDCKATDNSGNGHDGIINGNPVCVDGKKGKAFNFNAVGASDYIDLGTSIPSYNNFTIAGWINISRLPEYVGTNRHGTIFARGTASTDAFKSYSLYLEGSYSPSFLRSDIGIGDNFGGYDTVATKDLLPPPQTNTWIFVVSTYDGKQLSLFQDSKLISSTKTSRIPQAGNLQSSIGKSLNETYWNYDDSYGFTGLIDDLRIYNRALTEAEVLELYNGKAVAAKPKDPFYELVNYVYEKKIDDAVAIIPTLFGYLVEKHPFFKNSMIVNGKSVISITRLTADIKKSLTGLKEIDVKALGIDYVVNLVIDGVSDSFSKQIGGATGRYTGGAVWFTLKQLWALKTAADDAGGKAFLMPLALLKAQSDLLMTVVKKDIEEFKKLETASVDEVASVLRLQITTDKGAALASMYQDYFRAETVRDKIVAQNKIAIKQRTLLQHYLSGDMFSDDVFGSFGLLGLKESKTKAAQKAYIEWRKDLPGRLVKEEFDVKANITALVRLDKDEEAKRISKVLTGTDIYAGCLIDADNGLPTSKTCKNLVAQ